MYKPEHQPSLHGTVSHAFHDRVHKSSMYQAEDRNIFFKVNWYFWYQKMTSKKFSWACFSLWHHILFVNQAQKVVNQVKFQNYWNKSWMLDKHGKSVYHVTCTFTVCFKCPVGEKTFSNLVLKITEDSATTCFSYMWHYDKIINIFIIIIQECKCHQLTYL